MRQGQGGAGGGVPRRPAAVPAEAHRRRRVRPTPAGSASAGTRRSNTVADRLRALAGDHGPESVVFSSVSPSTSAIVDCVDWIQRLQRAFGSPNFVRVDGAVRLGALSARRCTRTGRLFPALYMPDLDRAECILFWGYNPSVSRLAHATATRGGAAPRREADRGRSATGRARLQGRSRGCGCAPAPTRALALAHHQCDDRAWLVRRGVRAPLDERPAAGSPGHRAAATRQRADIRRRPQVTTSLGTRSPPSRSSSTRPPAAPDVDDHDRLALAGTVEVSTATGAVTCRPAFDLVADQCRATSPAVAEEVTGVPAAEIEHAAQMLWHHRPVAFYTWSGLEQHSDTTQIIRAINVLYALTGCLDAPGGNVLFTPVPTNPIAGMELLDRAQQAKAIGVGYRPLGPARFGFVTGEDFYTSALEGRPVPAARARELRVEPADGPRRQRPRPGRAPGARFPRAPGPVHEPDRGAGRHRPAGDECVRGRGPEGRVRSLAGGAVAGTAARPAGASGGRGPLGHRDHLRPGDTARTGRALLRRRRRRRAGSTSWSRAGSGCDQLRADPAGVRVPLETRHTEVRGDRRQRRASWVRYSDGPDRAVRGTFPGRRPTTGPDLHRAGVEPSVAARPRRRVPAGAHVHEGSALLRDAVPPDRQPASPRPGSRSGVAPGHGGRGRHRRTGTGWRSRRRRAASGHAPRSTPRSLRASCAASTAGSTRARNSTFLAIHRSVRAAPTSTSSSARHRATRSAAARPFGPRSASSRGSPSVKRPLRRHRTDQSRSGDDSPGDERPVGGARVCLLQSVTWRRSAWCRCR